MESNQTQIFGKYKVVRAIGNGGFAQIYLVEDHLERLWALKQFYEHIKQGPSFAKDFEREARIHASLKHPHIVLLHDGDVEEGYLVVEYVQGRTLKELLDDDYSGGMDLHAVLEILRPIGDALTYIHEHTGYAHLDVAPKNILIRETRTDSGGTKLHPMLADFGLAHVIDQKGHAEGGQSRFGGTPRYWAPEQYDSAQGTPGMCSDIYTLGLVFGVMLTGKKPQEVLGILRGTGDAIPPEIKQVLQRATAEKPEERYDSVKSLITALEEVDARSHTNTVPCIPIKPEDNLPDQAKQLDSGSLDRPDRDRYPPSEGESGPVPVDHLPKSRYRQLLRGKLVMTGGIILLALLLIWAGIMGLGLSFPPNSDATPPSSSASLHRYCLGTDFPTSGKDATRGISSSNGADLAIAQNHDLSPGYTLDACDKDDTSPITGIHDPATGLQNVRQFIANSQVLGVVGPQDSNVARAEIPVAAQANLVLISPSAMDTCLTVPNYCVNSK